jgi:hypothetical protein
LPERISYAYMNREMEIGDVGTVVEVYESETLGVAYEVECVLANGDHRWMAELRGEFLEVVG